MYSYNLINTLVATIVLFNVMIANEIKYYYYHKRNYYNTKELCDRYLHDSPQPCISHLTKPTFIRTGNGHRTILTNNHAVSRSLCKNCSSVFVMYI